jgi:YD repeat-containing protein
LADGAAYSSTGFSFLRVHSGFQPEQDTVYAPCAWGKIWKVSAPYPSGQSAAYWTVYGYDGIGRTVSTVQPDGASTTTYSYSGNLTTVTDAAGKWKTFTNDSLGNLVSVTEPDPANQPGGTLTTSYSYDWMNHLSGVTMPRSSATQTRSFVYDDAGRLTSATNPENGTVSYYYNSNNTLQYKHDAKGRTRFTPTIRRTA